LVISQPVNITGEGFLLDFLGSCMCCSP